MPASPPLYVRLPNWIGDVCMSLPSLETLLASGAPVVVCARPWAQDLLSAYPLQGFVPMGAGWRGNRRAVRETLRHAGQPARGLLLPDSLSSALSFRLAGLPCAGYRDDGRSLLLRWAFAKPDTPLHAVQSWHRLTTQALAAWSLPIDRQSPADSLQWRDTPQQRAQAEAALADSKLQPGGFVLIAPTATGLHRGQIKVWPGFDTLTRALQAKGHAVIMCPPPSEHAAACANAPTATTMAPLSLGAFATLARMASLVVCNDSGVSHLAAAAGARQLTLFGVTDPARTGPWSPRAHCLGAEGRWPDHAQVLDTALALLSEEPAAA